MSYLARTNRSTPHESGRRPSPIYLDKTESFDNVLALKRPPRQRQIAFGWYGGKFNHLEWLLPRLPEAHHYCEPFAGSATVLLNREPSPVETYNDIDGDVVNFFRVLRERNADLRRAIAASAFDP
jgi:DNA adenine methylase